MGLTNYPNGITSFGVPVMGSGGGVPSTTGTYYFVDSTTGTAGGDAKSPTTAITTIDAAIGLCTANKGDTIVVMPNHAETITSAGAIACDVAGINIIGLGVGSTRPRITFGTAASASVLITAANVRIANIVGISGVDALTQPFDVRAAGCIIGDAQYGAIEWQDPASGTQAVRTILTTAAADNLRVNLKTSGITTGGTSPVNAVRLVGVDGAIINLDFFGRASTAVVEFVTTACTNVEIYGYIYNSGVTNSSKNVVDTVTGSTWYASVSDGAAGLDIAGGSAASFTGLASTDLQERVVAKAAATMVNGQTIFTVTGGAIKIEALASICVTGNDATASTLQYSITPTSGSAQTISGASASLANAAAGASVTLAGTALATAALLNANGPNLIANPGTIFCPAGTITMVIGTGSTTGTWRHVMRYKPLQTGVTVS